MKNNTIKNRRLLLLNFLILVPAVFAQDASDTVTMDVSVTLEYPDPSCTFSAGSIDFGTVYTGGRTREKDAEFDLFGEHVSSWVVSFTTPSELSDGANTLPLTVEKYRHPATSGTAGGLLETFSAGPWEFRAEVDGRVPTTQPPGTYTAAITAIATCPSRPANTLFRSAFFWGYWQFLHGSSPSPKPPPPPTVYRSRWSKHRHPVRSLPVRGALIWERSNIRAHVYIGGLDLPTRYLQR